MFHQDILRKTAKLSSRYFNQYSDSWIIHEIVDQVKSTECDPDLEDFGNLYIADPNPDCILGYNDLETISPDIETTYDGYGLIYCICTLMSNPVQYVKVLLDLGAIPSLYNTYTVYPTICNIDDNSTKLEVLKLLVDYGADINVYREDEFGSSPLESSICEDDEEIFHYYISEGVDVEYGEETPLQYACCQYKPKYVKLLIEAGANIRVKDEYGNSLIDSMFYCHEEHKQNDEDDSDFNYGESYCRKDTKNKMKCLKILVDAGVKY